MNYTKDKIGGKLHKTKGYTYKGYPYRRQWTITLCGKQFPSDEGIISTANFKIARRTSFLCGKCFRKSCMRINRSN